MSNFQNYRDPRVLHVNRREPDVARETIRNGMVAILQGYYPAAGEARHGISLGQFVDSFLNASEKMDPVRLHELLIHHLAVYASVSPTLTPGMATALMTLAEEWRDCAP